uniref:Putative salivary secreted protein n=1 Tax=Glossina morsitans morsitans TaxID=37546 RepID=D3TS51_GLOMM
MHNYTALVLRLLHLIERSYACVDVSVFHFSSSSYIFELHCISICASGHVCAECIFYLGTSKHNALYLHLTFVCIHYNRYACKTV